MSSALSFKSWLTERPGDIGNARLVLSTFFFFSCSLALWSGNKLGAGFWFESLFCNLVFRKRLFSKEKAFSVGL